jgi:CrcB protein
MVKTDMNFLFVALGGALGAVARYAISLIPVKTYFPILTLITNIIGAILILYHYLSVVII